MTAPVSLADLPESLRELLEVWLVEFDRTWNDGRLAERLREIPLDHPLRLPALAELVKIDQEKQWQRGRQVRLESYLQDYPALGTPDTVAADLILAEYELRQHLGVPLTPEEFTARFPRRTEELSQLAARTDGTLSTQARGTAATPPPFASASAAPRLPEQFGRYRVLRVLGRGGMGAVYLAHDTELDRPVALKVPRFAPEDGPDALRRFNREARAAAALRHPHVCPVYDVGQIDGIPYLIMAYIEGPSLSERMRTGPPLAPRQAAVLVRQLAQALQAAHDHGVIHRDLKPSNVLLNSAGEPALTDFGLARRLNQADERLTTSGAILGTPAYMSPEQVEGHSEAIGAGADVYGLGVILYELLTGKTPFRGSIASVLAQILSTEPERPSVLRSDLSPQLEGIVMRAMAKKASDRYASMADFAAALTRYLDSDEHVSQTADRAGPVLAGNAHSPGESTVPSGTDAAGRLPPPPRAPRSLRKALVPLVALVLLAGVIVIRIKDRNGKEHVIKVREGSQINITHISGSIPDSVQPPETPVTPGANRIPVDAPEAIKPVLKYTFNKVPDDYPVRWPRASTFSQDGKLVVFSTAGNNAELWDLDADKPLHTFKDNPHAVTAVAFDPKGKRVALGSYKQVRVLDVASGKQLALVEGFPNWVVRISFSQDGKFMHFTAQTFACDEPVQLLADPATGKLQSQTWERSWNWITSLDGNTILARGDHTSTLCFVNPKLGKIETGKDVPGWCGWIANDGQTVVTTFKETVALYNASSGAKVTGHELHTKDVTGVSLSPDGKLIASVAWDQTLILWDVAARAKKIGWRLEGIAGSPRVTFSPAGTVLATWSDSQKAVDLWSVTDGKRLGTVYADAKGMERVQFLPNDKFLATKDTWGKLKVWELETP